jgi:hypothetical protein
MVFAGHRLKGTFKADRERSDPLFAVDHPDEVVYDPACFKVDPGCILYVGTNGQSRAS